MDQLPSFGTEVFSSIPPTIKLFVPYLLKNAEAITSTHRQTYQYGTHERQFLDVYTPSSTTTKPLTTNTVLVFAYGGGLTQGDKVLGRVPQGLVYKNLAYFFCEQYGVTTVVVDYRLMAHGAKFPSGGEDVLGAVDWIKHNTEKFAKDGDKVDVYLMGNSAGGLHVSTALFAPQLESLGEEALSGNVTLKGAVLLAVPLDMNESQESRAETTTKYFGDVKNNTPLGLLTNTTKEKFADSVLAKSYGRLLFLTGSLDPEDEILSCNRRFEAELATKGHVVDYTVVTLEGHNHISPVFGVGTGEADMEAWAHVVGKWLVAGAKI